MSRIKELRASLDKTLDALEHRASALEAQLTQTKDQAVQRLEQRKQQLQDVLRQVQTEVQKSKDLAEQAKAEVKAKLDHLHVQLALGKADARDAVEEQRTKILKALSEFEAVADQKLKGAAFESGKIWEDLIGRASSLEAEFEALKGRFEIEKARQQATLDEKKRDVLVKLQAIQRDLKAKRQDAQAKGEAFAHDLRKGLDQVQAAFRKLFE
jgi:hypothetical protein